MSAWSKTSPPRTIRFTMRRADWRERMDSPLNSEPLSNSVYQPLPRSLDPEVMQEVTALARDHVDRRKALFGAAAIGVSALAALFVVLMVHASQKRTLAHPLLRQYSR